jgi:ribosome-binding protein aMBF1 (putative translation factor)
MEYQKDIKFLIAHKIISALRHKGWTNKYLAQKLNRTPAEISKWVSGKHNFTIDTLHEIEKCLGINLLNTKQDFVEYCKPCMPGKFVKNIISHK